MSIGKPTAQITQMRSMPTFTKQYVGTLNQICTEEETNHKQEC